MSSLNNDGVWSGLQGIIRGIEAFATALEKANTWYQDNSEKISEYLLVFADFSVWSIAVDKLIERQIVFTDDLPQELATEIYNGADIERLISSYYFENNAQNMEQLINRCQHYEQIQKYSELYAQTISAYHMNHCLLACIGLFSLIDGVLADVSDQTTTNFKSRLNIVKEKIGESKKLNEIDRKTFCIYRAFKSFDSSIFFNSDLSKEEPQRINRHWDLHGRTHREHDKIDFLKVLLWLDAIIFMSRQDLQQSEEGE